MQHHSLTCYGVGDGAACGDRFHAASLYRLGDTSILIDCGEPITRSLKAEGLDCNTIDHVLITHTHGDHIGGLFMLLQGFWLDQRSKPLVVRMPADAIEPIRQMLQTMYLFDELLPYPLHLEPHRPDEPVVVGGARVTAHRTSHLDAFRAQFGPKHPADYAAYSFLIESSGLRIVHSGDMGSPRDLETLLDRPPIDLLVCEMAHFKPADLFRFLKGRDIRHTIFTHLGGVAWKNLSQTQQLAAEMLAGMKFTFARDLQRFEI